jgi:HTH-type transcriptional regulator/antitoxin HipB
MDGRAHGREKEVKEMSLMRKWEDMINEMDPKSQQEIEVIRERAAMVAQLIAIREHKGWTQEELAKRARMKQSAIARFEGDTTMPSMGTVLRVARALGVRPTFIPTDLELSAAAAKEEEDLVIY